MPATVEVVDRIVPQIINVNKYIERIVEKLVEVPHLLREIEVVKEMHERNVPGPQNTNTVMKTVDLAMEKEVIREKERVVTERVNSIEQVLQVVSDIMERDREPVIITHDRVIEVPHVLEKIVERMVIMPQVHEVLKYVHEVFENDNQAVGAGLDIGIEAKEYKVLGEELEGGLADFLTELNKFKSLQPSSAPRIALLEQYLSKFRRFIKYPKIHELIREKVVEKEKFVKVPAQRSEADTLDDLAKMILIEKLVTEISRLKQANPSLDLQLDDDVKFIFGLSFDGKVKDVSEKLNSQLREFEQSLNRKFSKMGGWSLDHQEMLRSFLQ